MIRFPSREEARDWLALLYIPILTFCGAGLALIIWLGPWPADTAAQRLNYLGLSLLGVLALIAFGNFYLQRRTVNLKVETPGVKVEAENVSPGP